MGKENPTPEVKPEEKAGNLLDNDTLRKLYRAEVDFDDLSAEQKTEFHARFVEGDEEGIPTEEEEAAAVAAEAAKAAEGAPSKGTSPPEGTPPPDPTLLADETPAGDEASGDESLKRKLKEATDRANTLQQKYDSVNKRLFRIENMRLPEPPKIEDELDENVAKQNQFNQEMASRVNSWVDAESAALRVEKEQLQETTMYSQVGQLQAENSELSTSKPIEVLDKAFSRFRDNLSGAGATAEQKSKAVQEFFSNAEVRKAKEAEGIIFPIDEKDWANYQVISRILSFRRTGGDPNWDPAKQGDKYPDYDSAYYKFRKVTGFVPDPVRQAAADASAQVLDQVTGSQNQPSLLSPGDGKPSEGVDGMTAEQAEQWLLGHPTASTPEERATLNAIMKKFSSGGQGGMSTPAAPAQKEGLIF